MRVIYDYQKTQDGYKLDMSCEEMTQLESGAFDRKKYTDCFKAILKDIQDNHKCYLDYDREAFD